MALEGWRRVTSASPCDFCAAAASRGNVYSRSRSADFEAHDGCSCTAEPVWRREPDPAATVELRAEYERVTAGVTGEREKRAAWRRYWRTRPGAGVDTRTVAELRELARQRGVRGYSRMRKAELAQAVDSAPPLLSTAGQRAVADALVRAGEVLDLSERARAHTAASLRRELAADQAQAAAPLLDALEAGSAAAVREAIPAVARAAGLRPIGAPGEVLRLPGSQVEWIGTARNQVVQVVRPGWQAADGRVVQRAAVQAATPEQVARLAPAKAAKARAKKAAAQLTPEQQTMRAVPAGLFRQAGAPTLTRVEREALREYRSSFFVAINGQLRRQDLSERMTRIVSRIDGVMARSRLRQEIVVWRGVGRGRVFGDRIGDDLTGFEWTERAYLSTSVEAREAMSFARPDIGEMPIVLRVKASEGTGAVRISPIGDQGEILLERGLRLRVTGDGTTKVGLATVRVLDVEIVPAVTPAKAAKKAAKAGKAAPKAPPAPERMTAPALRTELQRAGVDLDLASVPKSELAGAVTRLRGGSPAAAERARLRQAVIDRQRAAAQAMAEALENLDEGAEFSAVRARARLRRIESTITGWPQEAPTRALLTAMATGRPAVIRRAVATAERKLGLRPVGAVDQVSTMDRAVMSVVGDSVRDGSRVVVVRPGYTVDIAGERVVLAKAVVREAPAPSTGQRVAIADVSVEKAVQELGQQLADVERLVERGASARAVISTMRSRMRRLRLDPVDAAGNTLTASSLRRAVRYVWRRPGGDVDLSGPVPEGWTAGERREFDIAQQLARTALAVEEQASTVGVTGDLVSVARGARA